MTFRFTTQKLVSGLYEPEGLYLHSPFEGQATILQGWGADTEYLSTVTYHGTPLKGHPGIDFELSHQTKILAVEDGRVCEIGFERGGFMQYLKLEHRWGESFYAYLGEIVVDSGQIVSRGTHLSYPMNNFFHFGIRVAPYNRLDGWGGFTDPTPFLNPNEIIFMDETEINPELLQKVPFQKITSKVTRPLHTMLQEKINVRRP